MDDGNFERVNDHLRSDFLLVKKYGIAVLSKILVPNLLRQWYKIKRALSPYFSVAVKCKTMS